MSATAQPAATAATTTRRTGTRTTSRKMWARLGMTALAVAFLFIFLVPLANMVFMSLKTMDQMTEPGAPIYPASPATYEYEGKELPVYEVPLEDGSTQELAMLKPGRRVSTFIDPSDPTAEPIEWQGAWRTLDRPWSFDPTWSNFPAAWNAINFPRLFVNTLAIALIGIVGTLISCVLVAYGFARFRFPGRDLLFSLLIATIFLPVAVTVVPTYAFFAAIGWVNTWLPLTVPHFFANAYNVFLLRQYFMTIPREIDEAAMIDGASPLRILTSIIVPMSTPVIVAVSLFHLVFAWNDFFAPLIYLSSDAVMNPSAAPVSRSTVFYGSTPPLTQAAALMASFLPIVLFFLAQRVFMQGVVVTGVEK